jgi:hypothetical protein
MLRPPFPGKVRTMRIDPDRPEERVDIVDQDDAPPAQEYTPPALIVLGTLEELTHANGGPVCVMA